MAKLKIVKMGDDVLRKVCRPVEKITPRTVTLLDDMIETMRDADGCGLAAPQVGVLRRIAVVEVEPGEVIELINPKIIAYAGEQDHRFTECRDGLHMGVEHIVRNERQIHQTVGDVGVGLLRMVVMEGEGAAGILA